MSPNDTICAIATPPGHGGIGVVRISGPGARNILAQVWMGRVGPKNFESRKLYLGVSQGDRAFAVFMEAPHTYTGEDIAEVSCHGSPVILRRVLEACVKAGARIAGPGEFTRRAFLAGKIDLAQAEAVADVINAASERAAKLASDQLDGSLSAKIGAIADDISALRAEIEASIDFPEEDIGAPERIDVLDRLDDATNGLKKLSATFREGRLIRDGARVAIIGAPNAGKSSVFNRLAGRDRAIVHHEAGTTRDVVEETVTFEGVAFNLRDTAGLRNSPGEVEGLGIERTNDEIESADAILAVIDGSKNQEDESRAAFARLDRAKTIFVVNKSDLPRANDPPRGKPRGIRCILPLEGGGYPLASSCETRLRAGGGGDHCHPEKGRGPNGVKPRCGHAALRGALRPLPIPLPRKVAWHVKKIYVPWPQRGFTPSRERKCAVTPPQAEGNHLVEDGSLKNLSPLFVSAKTGEGMEEIIQRLVQTASTNTSFHEGVVIANVRHKEAVDRAIVSLESARATFSKSEPPEFAAGHLRTAQDFLGEITGEVTTEEILDRIFSRFCIGK